MQTEKSFVPSIVCAIIAAVFLTMTGLAASTQINDPFWIPLWPYLSAFLALVCLVFLLSGFALGWNWFAWNEEARHEMRKMSDSITAFSRASDSLGALSDERAALLPPIFGDELKVVAVLGKRSITRLIYIEEVGFIDREFLERFVKNSSGMYLWPVDQTGDKSRDRKILSALTRELIRCDFATANIGPHSAKWVNGGRVLFAAELGISLNEQVGE